MRTTVTLDQDVAAAVRRLRTTEGLGLSEALNRLVRTGLTVKQQTRKFQQRTVRLGLQVDVTNIGEALEVLDGPTGR
ncbi:MAG: ribbon-helix-helix protein, CopG family [Chloroflexi bacterium]|nr:ribbon-helix-helix protein, CopG family [Chloroflexota bacterium]